MIANLLPVEATHTSLDLFEKPPLLVTFDGSFEQKIGPLYSPSGALLEFEVVGDRNNFIDLQRIYLEVKVRIKQSNGDDLRHDGGDDANSDAPYFVNNILHALFSECTVSANGIQISHANGHYAHKCFIETEFSHGTDAKSTWLQCQGYVYETNPALVDGAHVTYRKEAVRESTQLQLYGKLPVDFFSCDKHLINDVSLRIAFRRTPDDFCTIAENADKHYKVEIDEANIYVRKMIVAEDVVTAIGSVLEKTPSIYRYNEVISKTFLAPAGGRSWKKEDIFSREPIRRMVIAMNTNQSFLGTNRTSPFHYRKFNLQQVVVSRNGLPIAGTPMSTVDDKRLYFNSLNALAFIESGHGISLQDYPNHFVMVFDLTSTQEASHDFIHPELTNASLSVELTFSEAIADNLEILFLGEKASTVYIDSTRNVSKNVPIAPKKS